MLVPGASDQVKANRRIECDELAIMPHGECKQVVPVRATRRWVRLARPHEAHRVPARHGRAGVPAYRQADTFLVAILAPLSFDVPAVFWPDLSSVAAALG